MHECKKQQTDPRDKREQAQRTRLAALAVRPHGALCTLVPEALMHYTEEDPP